MVSDGAAVAGHEWTYSEKKKPQHITNTPDNTALIGRVGKEAQQRTHLNVRFQSDQIEKNQQLSSLSSYRPIKDSL